MSPGVDPGFVGPEAYAICGTLFQRKYNYNKIIYIIENENKSWKNMHFLKANHKYHKIQRNRNVFNS